MLASFTSIALLVLIELSNVDTAPYIGLLTYILLPAGLTFGIAIIFLGLLVEKWRRRKLTPSEIGRVVLQSG